MTHRLYIDESGDHTYQKITDLDRRYLGLTGVLIHKQRYQQEAQPGLERLKQDIFRYDADNPPILVRQQIKRRKGPFYVLQNETLSEKWENGLLSYVESLLPYTQVFTVVIDKPEHLKRFPVDTFDAYEYSLAVLLNRVRGYLNILHTTADVIAESRGRREDEQLKRAYRRLRNEGPPGGVYGTPAEYRATYPSDELIMRRKDQNVAGFR